MGKVLAAYGGGFKPPTKGHLEVVKRALAAHPEIDEFIIYVGGKERNGIGQTEAILIWDMYKKYLPMKVKIEPSKLPIKDVLSLGKNNPDDTVYFVIGGREGRQDDLDDIADRTKNVEKTYPNMRVKVQTTPDEGMSGTNARKAAKISSDKLSPYLPDELTDEEKEEVFNIIRPIVKEDYFGLNQFAREIAEGVLNEGKYDSLVTKLAGYTLNAWKGDFKDGQNKGYFEVEVGPGREFDYPHLTFNYSAQSNFGDFYKIGGLARPRMKMPEVKIEYWLDAEELPRMWEQISMSLRNTIRHEIEHLMQSGSNVKKGKEMGDDSREREELKTGKKPWWKIWRKTLGTPDYYKLEKEIDANLQGLYFKAKKLRQPLEKVIDIYLQYTLNLPVEDREDIKALWKERAPKLNIPLEEIKFINEDISKSQLDAIEKYADGLFNKLGIDIEFTKHFLERVNDKRNVKPITTAELIGMFKRLYKKHGKPLSKIDDDLNAVVKDFNNNINIPFAINVTDDDIEMYAKTVMRKKDFKTSTPVIALQEGRYDQEVLLQSRFIMNIFKSEIGEKFEGDFEGQLEDIYYDLELLFNPQTFGILGPTPFIVNAAADGDSMTIQIDYNPESFPEAYNELNAEIKDALRHELEHVGQFNFDKGVRGGDNSDDLPLFDYLTLDYEIPAFVQGLYKKAKTRKITLDQAIDEFLDERVEELSFDESKKIKQIWINWAKENLPKAQINENATYSKKIDLVQYLASLTQHMLDKGMNIEPLPALEFIDGDSKNASDFFGKTAYYDPNTQTIVLYTEGRHPKDIARSYTHEMIHHIQNLENRLGNITTTNTTEDDELDQIEREAYLNGNMTFRNWTDSLNEIQTPAKEEDVNPKE